MSDSMIERGAKGLCFMDGKAWDQITDQAKARYMSRAHVVIEAMREPTGAMVCNAVTFEVTIPDVKVIWAAMIDAALNETDPK